MSDITDILNNNGRKGVNLYKDSLTQNDRVATGKTRDSLRYEVKEDLSTSTLTFYGRKDISDLEDGQTAEQIRAKGDFFEQLNEWVRARGLGDRVVTGLIMSDLRRTGWNTDLPNRTAPNGGTSGILSIPSDQIIKETTKDLGQAAVKTFLKTIRGK